MRDFVYWTLIEVLTRHADCIKKTLQRFSKAVRRRYLGLYGDQVRQGQRDNSDGEAYDLDESS